MKKIFKITKSNLLMIALSLFASYASADCVQSDYRFSLNRKINPNDIKCVISVSEVVEDDSNFSCNFSAAFQSNTGGVYATTFGAQYSCDKRGMYGSYKLLLSFWTGVTLPFLIGDQAASFANRVSARNLVYSVCSAEREQLMKMLCNN